MDKMNPLAVYSGFEMVPAIHGPFLGTPVVLSAPVGNELPDIGEVRAVIPVRVGQLARPAHAVEPLLQIVQHCIWNSNRKRFRR